MFKLAALGVSVAAALAAAGINAATEKEHVTAAPSIADMSALSDELDLPLVLPEVMPDGYRWADQIAFEAVSRHARSRTIMFHAPETGRSLQICIARAVDACDPRPGDRTLRVEHGLIVVLHFWGRSDPGDLARWLATDLTADLSDVAWLER